MARGRPILATILITTGVIALAVPGSSAFAAEFLVLNGVFTLGWGWAVVGAIAIVLAAMYILRAISAALHEEKGPAVHDRARDLRPAEVGMLMPARRRAALPQLLACRRHRPQLRRRAEHVHHRRSHRRVVHGG